MNKPSLDSACKSMIAGTAGGLLATVAMTTFQAAWSRAVHPPTHGTPESQEDPTDDPATVKMADTAARAATGESLSEEGKKAAGTIVHYAIGAAAGALYGLADEYAPEVKSGRGLAYGAGVWAIGDHVITPAAGFSKPATEYPASSLLYGFLAHCVFGLALYESTRLIRGRIADH